MRAEDRAAGGARNAGTPCAKLSASWVCHLKKSLLLKDIRQLVIMAVIILTGRSVLADWYVVPTGSMKPTIMEGDRVFVWKSAYQFRVPFSRIRLFKTGTPKRSDVVVVRNPDGGSVPVREAADRAPGRQDRAEERGPLREDDRQQSIEFLPERTGDDGETVLLGTETLQGTKHPVRILPERAALRTFGPIVVPEDEGLSLGRQPRRESGWAVLRNPPRLGTCSGARSA